MQSKHILITGKVQGVFFRAHLQRTARTLGFTGWVRNRPDGRVEAVLEGAENNWAAMLDWCRQGPPAAVVREVTVSDEPYTGNFTDFTVLY